MEKLVVTKRRVRYNLVTYFNPKAVMFLLDYRYDDSKTLNKNCIDFLKWVECNDKWVEVWNNMFPNDKIEKLGDIVNY